MSVAPAPTNPLYERAAALVEQLFEAPGDPSCWNRMLAALCREISEDAVALVAAQTSVGSPAFLIGDTLNLNRLDFEILEPSLAHPPPHEMPVGAVIPIPPADAAFARTTLFRDLLRPAGVAPGPGLFVVVGRSSTRITGALLVLSRDPSWLPRPEDRALLELLAPYLGRAGKVGFYLNERRSGIEAMLSIFDALVLGVVLLDEKSEVSFANQAAARLLGTSAGLSRPGPAGVAESKARSEALRALLRREAADSAATLSPSPLPGARPLRVFSTPLRVASDVADTRFATALFLGDPGLGAAGPEHLLASLHGLSPAEERLTRRLASGETLFEAAAWLGIRPSTARGVLRSVFKKTGTHRQAELVRLVLTLVGQLREQDPRG